MKKKLIAACLTVIFLFAAMQMAIFCHGSLFGPRLAFLEEAIGKQEKIAEDQQLAIARKTSLAELTRFAARNGYDEPLEIFTITPETPVAFKSR